MTWSRVKKIILGVLILLSIILSWNLWFTGGEPQTESESVQTTSQSSASLVDHAPEEVYAPYQMLLHGSSSYVLNQAQALEPFNTTFDTIVINEISTVQNIDRQSYYQLLSLSIDRWFEGVFSDQVPIGLINDRFEDLPSDLANSGIDRVAFNLDGLDDVLLYNTSEELLYITDVESINTEEINSLVSNESTERTEVMTQEINNNFVYLPTNRGEVDYQDFVIERLPNSFFINELFPDTSSVEVMSSGEETRYVDITTEVRIDNENYVLTYLRQRQNVSELSNVERFSQSYGELNRLVNWASGVHYYNFDESENMMTYQRFINGLPVYDQNNTESMVDIKVTSSGLANMEVPIRILQTPISYSDSETKEMPSANEIIGAIESIPEYFMTNVEGLRLGLNWVEPEETEEVVHFEPSWFINDNGEWRILEDFVEENGGTISGL